MPSKLYAFGKALLCGTGFETVQRVRVKSLRLRALNAFVRLIALVYLVYELVLQRGYLEFEPAAATFNPWDAWPLDGSAPVTDARRNQTCSPEYLASLSYGENFTLSQAATTGYFFTNNTSCRDFEPDIHIISGASSANFVTFENIEDASVTSSFVYAGVEDAMMNLIHSFSVPFRAGSVTNPDTVVLDQDGNVAYEFKDSFVTGIPVAEWLRLAGIESGLDSLQPRTSGSLDVPDPRLRITGLVLLVRFEYFNSKDSEWFWEAKDRCEVTVEAMEGAWGFLGTKMEAVMSPTTGDVALARVTRNVVQLAFVAAGELGTFSFRVFSWNLIELYVYVALASYFIDLLALQYLTRRPSFHKSSVLELPRKTATPKVPVLQPPNPARAPPPLVAAPTHAEATPPPPPPPTEPEPQGPRAPSPATASPKSARPPPGVPQHQPGEPQHQTNPPQPPPSSPQPPPQRV